MPTDPDITPEQMEQRIARFATLVPTKKKFDNAGVGIPEAAYEYTAARNIFFLMAPEGVARGGTSRPAVTGQPGLEVSIVDCPPGNGAALHRHERTWETFMPLTGPYEIIWGDNGRHRVVLQPFDLIAVPAGIYRAFRNAGTTDAKMLVLIQGGQEIMNDLLFDHAVGERIRQDFGDGVLANFRKIGTRFAEEAGA